MYPEDYSEAKITFCHLPTSVILYSVYITESTSSKMASNKMH